MTDQGLETLRDALALLFFVLMAIGLLGLLVVLARIFMDRQLRREFVATARKDLLAWWER